VSLIGVFLLIGIVVTNAIVLVDLINQYRTSWHEGDRSDHQRFLTSSSADPDDRYRDDLRCCLSVSASPATAASSRNRSRSS
jgi:hypothetical protein